MRSLLVRGGLLITMDPHRRFTTLDEREIRQAAERSIEQLLDRVRFQLPQ